MHGMARRGDATIYTCHENGALHLAAFFGNADAARAVLESGANVNARNVAFQTPLHLALLNGKDDVTRLLLAHGADPDLADAEGNTALHYLCSAASETPAMLRALLEQRPNLNKENAARRTPLYCAQKGDLIEYTLILLQNGGVVTRI